jgi:hypothetical protein
LYVGELARLQKLVLSDPPKLIDAVNWKAVHEEFALCLLQKVRFVDVEPAEES